MERSDYDTQCKAAADSQGIAELVAELSRNGVTATVEQTGGFTMAALIDLGDNWFIWANTEGGTLVYTRKSGNDEECETIAVGERSAVDVAQTLSRFVQRWHSGLAAMRATRRQVDHLGTALPNVFGDDGGAGYVYYDAFYIEGEGDNTSVDVYADGITAGLSECEAYLFGCCVRTEYDDTVSPASTNLPDITWYAIYQDFLMDDGMRDADYQPFLTREEAIAEAKSWLELMNRGDCEIFVIPVPTAWYASLTEDEEFVLWDRMGEIADSDYIWIRRGDCDYTQQAIAPAAPEYPRRSGVVGHGEMIVPAGDGTAKTLLEQIKCLLEGRGTFDYADDTGELIIRTGLIAGMGGELSPNDDEAE